MVPLLQPAFLVTHQKIFKIFDLYKAKVAQEYFISKGFFLRGFLYESHNWIKNEMGRYLPRLYVDFLNWDGITIREEMTFVPLFGAWNYTSDSIIIPAGVNF